MVNGVFHGNGTTETVALASHGMARPHAIDVKNSVNTVLWRTGTYGYDGGGNVKSLTVTGPPLAVDQFQYDKFSRLVEARLDTLGVPRQVYGFDAYGNLTSVTTGSTIENFPVLGTTNRLHSTIATYDAGGNLTSWNGNGYTFDLPGQMRELNTSEEIWSYLYTADDERLVANQTGGFLSIWSLRGLDGRLLTRAELEVGIQDIQASVTDYAYRNEGAVAASTTTTSSGGGSDSGPSGEGPAGEGSGEVPDGLRHFGLDHLGTIRLITGPTGAVVAQHTYYPFGREATSTAQDDEILKFTGHERDLLLSTADAADDLEYMHARFYSPVTGRSLSVDPVGGVPKAPQSWNRYAYVLGNPLKYIDPTGQLAESRTPYDECSSGGIKCAIRQIILGLLPKPPKADPDDTNVQALEEAYGEAKEHPTNLAGNVQQGLNEATADIGAVTTNTALLVGSNKAINVMTKGLGHAVRRHTVVGDLNKDASLSLAGENLANLAKAASSATPSPSHGNLVFVMNAGRTIGHDIRRGNGPTSFYTVVTDTSRNLITVHPGLPKGW